MLFLHAHAEILAWPRDFCHWTPLVLEDDANSLLGSLAVARLYTVYCRLLAGWLEPSPHSHFAACSFLPPLVSECAELSRLAPASITACRAQNDKSLEAIGWSPCQELRRQAPRYLQQRAPSRNSPPKRPAVTLQTDLRARCDIACRHIRC
ncbi:hypothetical protein M441DRAFT_326136 [Trichoderma asperellum CBS 433.97]|uniref:Uncharacterized protein n=1 Tax=Trichoderma asperellum (strain ATCC 204424 / CBS 433.97 / NBRC 101777) TaxID=1042311 RepID=A0A2T3ZM08_TRIA4|nr:hypothetical protein M441DRAFT_326136 [Trichoderma asperellum CBS 433.97]PTB45838.1 hypothetical protein M441DRAFT_326136 [Trichoderma asperellum CBS 433.97]